MQELLYTPLDIAIIVYSMELGCRAESAMIDSIWTGETAFLPSKYRNNQRRFILDVRYWLDYLYDKPLLDKEFPAIQRDAARANGALVAEQFVSNFSELDLFFKSIRIRTLYNSEKHYARMKLRTLLRAYGYQRRSKQLLEHINLCLSFYHLETALRGGTPCRIEDVGLDDMLVFRVV